MKITPQMAERGRQLLADGKSLKEAAAELGVDQSALGYHMRGGKSTRYLKRPWVPHLKAAYAKIGIGEHEQAACHFRIAADVLADYGKGKPRPMPDVGQELK